MLVYLRLSNEALPRARAPGAKKLLAPLRLNFSGRAFRDPEVGQATLPPRPTSQHTSIEDIAGTEIVAGPFASQETAAIMTAMGSTKYIYWQDKDQWLGYLQDYPDYWTQGQSIEELESHLCDLYRDLTSGEIPGVRKLAELTLR